MLKPAPSRRTPARRRRARRPALRTHQHPAPPASTSTPVDPETDAPPTSEDAPSRTQDTAQKDYNTGLSVDGTAVLAAVLSPVIQTRLQLNLHRFGRRRHSPNPLRRPDLMVPRNRPDGPSPRSSPTPDTTTMTRAEPSPCDDPRVVRQHCDALEHGGHLAGGFDRDDLPHERPCQDRRTPAPWRAAPSGVSSSHTTSST